MNITLKNTLKTLALGILLATSLHSAQAQAPPQISHTWVSGILIRGGSMGTSASASVDSGACDRANPCATFNYALGQTLAGGTISAVNAGDYGPVTINKSVTIDGTGTLAAISGAVNTSAITISGAGNTVILRHLTLNGLGTAGSTGILVNSGNVVVDDCKLTGFTTAGIDLAITSGTEIVQNTAISNSPQAIGIRIGAASSIGIAATAVKSFGFLQASPLLASLKDVTVEDAMVGVQAFTGATDIKDSLLTQNMTNAVSAQQSGVTISVSGCVLSGNNSSAVTSVAGAIVRLTNNDIFNNGGAIDNTGRVSTTGDNRRAGNTTATTPTAPSDQPSAAIVQQ